MQILESIIDAFSDFLRAMKYDGILKEYDLSFELAPILNDEAKAATKISFHQLMDRLTSLQVAQTVVEKSTLENSSLSVIDTDKNVEDMDVESVKEENSEKGVSLAKNADPFVQIKVDRDELDRRIACFTSRKRKEIEEANCKEFCNNVLLDEDNPLFNKMNSCARVDAIYPHRQNFIKVSRVDNCWGPQTVHTGPTQVTIKQEHQDEADSSMPKDFEERLRNVESHLNFEPESKQRKYLYSWLKDLEDRILFLESVSPEYFNHKDMKLSSLSSPKKKSMLEKVELYESLSIEELSRRKLQLKEELKSKLNHRKQVGLS